MARGEGYVKDLKGKRFGKLVVVGFVHRVNSYPLWKCKCDCGVEKEISGYDLSSGKTKSCTCLRKDKALPYGESSFNQLFVHYKGNASRRGLSFRLSKKKVKELTQKNCHYCGVVPSQKYMHTSRNHGGYVYNGIDRVNNRYGYYAKNCVPCCKTCNGAKSNMKVEEFMLWIERLITHRNK